MKVRLYLLLAVLPVSACVSTNHYNWGSYPEGLYQYYSSPEKHNKIRAQLVADLQNLEKRQALVPPGLYAEAGTYFLEQGDSKTALEYYKKEYAAWPESRGLMSSLIANLERNNDAR